MRKQRLNSGMNFLFLNFGFYRICNGEKIFSFRNTLGFDVLSCLNINDISSAPSADDKAPERRRKF